MLLAINVALISIIPVTVLVTFGCCGLAYVVIIKLTKNIVRKNSEQIAYESNQTLKSLQEGLGGIRDVLIDGTQDYFCEKYLKSEKKLRRAQGSNQILSNGPRYFMEVLAMMLLAILAYILTKQATNAAAAVPTLAAIALGMQRLLPALQQIYWAWSTIHGAQASLQDALELLDQKIPDHQISLSKASIRFEKDIRLNNISYRYTQQTPWVFREVNLVINKGSRVGFIGTTGSGKSTLLDIVMGLLQPSEGSLKVDGTEITPPNLSAWQSRIAHVPQAIYLSDNSIEENIAFGIHKTSIDSQRVKHAAEQAQIANLIEEWPNKYNTTIGERGVQLSGGQRQRIGIARALYKEADIIIFDEATSALDNETEQFVMNAIENLSENITIFIIAHRLTTVKNCTHIIEMRDGKIYQTNGLIND
ncbi:hypothetical protein ZMTM_15430 [Methyloradius palustris]|uniref:ABC transporter ATP-binding protein n=2 Tax=Methyloradius palustris TaxID=2778876 RepID=A0A8D5GEL0_9PROT|nr:hypothetical protein ZMTM_15430 [Methyloradius palustris]